jgi:hypothetical protein
MVFDPPEMVQPAAAPPIARQVRRLNILRDATRTIL